MRLLKSSMAVKALRFASMNAPAPHSTTTCAALTAMLYEKQPAPGVGNAVQAAADVGEAKRQVFTFGRRATREPFGRLRWSTTLPNAPARILPLVFGETFYC